MTWGLICIVAAFVFYTTSIWSERIIKKLLRWMVLILAAGFACDLAGTNAMRISAATHALNWHTVCGYLALVIMFANLIWAILAICEFKKPQEWFRRYSIYAWFLWLVAFISGVPKV